jgi:hypothetical protein
MSSGRQSDRQTELDADFTWFHVLSLAAKSHLGHPLQNLKGWFKSNSLNPIESCGTCL